MKKNEMMKRAVAALLFLCLVPSLQAEEAGERVYGAGLKYDTFGSLYIDSAVIGIEGVMRRNEHWAFRTGIYYGSSKIDEFDFKEEFDFLSVPLLVDWHPFRGNFRLTGGVFLTDKSFKTTSTDPRFGEVSAKGSFSSLAPYVGFGWGMKNQSRRLSINADIGILFLGSASISTSGSGSGRAFEQEMSFIREEAEFISEDLEAYPFISLGLMYRF